MIALACVALVVAIAGGVVAQGHVPPGAPKYVGPPLLAVDVRQTAGQTISPLLFGLGVDLPTGTYVQPGDTRCAVLTGAASAVTLVRIGAATADDYDWRSDAYFDPHHPNHPARRASSGCLTPPSGAGATILRVLDRVRALHIDAVVVLNGEIDDPQSAAGLVRLIAQRYGLAFTRALYWEIGSAPATWQHFGVPLADRHPEDHLTCSPDQYAAVVTSYEAAIAAALGVTDQQQSSLTINVVADQWIANATDQSWTAPTTVVDTQYYPFNSPNPALSDPAAIAASISGIEGGQTANLDQQLDSLRANLKLYGGGSDLSLFVGQWNIDASSQASNALYDSAIQAVFVGRLLLHFARDGVDMAAWAPPLYASPQSQQAPFAVSGDPTPGFRAFTALHALAGARLLRVSGTAGLDVLAARLPDGRIAVVLVNAAGLGAVTLRLRVSGISSPRVAATVQTFAPVSSGAPVTRTVTPTDVRLSVPTLSLMLLTLR